MDKVLADYVIGRMVELGIGEFEDGERDDLIGLFVEFGRQHVPAWDVDPAYARDLLEGSRVVLPEAPWSLLGDREPSPPAPFVEMVATVLAAANSDIETEREAIALYLTS